MNEELKKLIEKETGVVINGEITVNDALAIYNFLKPFFDEFFPQITEFEDAMIDMIEERAKSRSGLRKKAALAFCSGLRTVLKCPDDDDNVTQK